ncbi:MAG TPA: helix-turn-helix transcriptional regulator [Thiopseudomonas sp.]|nr:helix-turn-helix transcriptional regulator [Thiopseudomonas sp.]
MDVQVISRDGQPEYAVLPWAQYQQLLKEAGRSEQASQSVEHEAGLASLRELKAIREQAGLSIDDVARDAGISPHYLQMIESGEREASAVLKRALARALKVSGWNNE